ncbi:MAG: ABC transporter ATP-binding protein, partial [Eubacterium sp.]
AVENVMLPLRLQKNFNFAVAEKKALALLKKVGLERQATQTPKVLSGGEQQRVILARALTQDTECLILDEPTNHLDIKYQLQLMNIVKGLKLTVVAAIHDLNIAAMYCDEICALKEGRILRSGPPKDVLTPDFIKEIYEVETEVLSHPKTGQLHVLYQPKF